MSQPYASREWTVGRRRRRCVTLLTEIVSGATSPRVGARAEQLTADGRRRSASAVVVHGIRLPSRPMPLRHPRVESAPLALTLGWVARSARLREQPPASLASVASAAVSVRSGCPEPQREGQRLLSSLNAGAAVVVDQPGVLEQLARPLRRRPRARHRRARRRRRPRGTGPESPPGTTRSASCAPRAPASISASRSSSSRATTRGRSSSSAIAGSSSPAIPTTRVADEQLGGAARVHRRVAALLHADDRPSGAPRAAGPRSTASITR